jgi:hypothetical protein
MATEPINIPIQTSYDDEGAKDALKDAEKLERLEPTVVVDADTAAAKTGIDDVQTSAQDLIDRNPWVAEVLSDTADAKADLEALQGKLRDTGETADNTSKQVDKVGRGGGPQVGTQALADMLGPLGDVSGAASEAGQAVEGIGQFAEAAAAKMGIESAAMSGAIGGIGIAIGLAAAVWSVYKNKQEEAKKKAAEHLKVVEDITSAIKDGNKEVASSKFLDLYRDIITKGHEAGLSTNEIVDSIRGVGDAAPEAAAKIRDLQDRIDDMRKARDDADTAAEKQTIGINLDVLVKQRDALKDAATEFGNLTDKQKANEQLQGDVQTALFGTTGKLDDTAAAADRAKQKADDLTAAFDTLKGNIDIKRQSEDMAKDFDDAFLKIHSGMQPSLEDIRGLEDDIVRAGEVAGANPIDVQMAVDKIDEGDLAGAHADAQSWLNQHALTVKIQATSQSVQDVINKIKNPFQQSGTQAAGTSVSTVNMILPRGLRTADIARALSLSTRRNGRRYGNPSGVVSYARR